MVGQEVSVLGCVGKKITWFSLSTTNTIMIHDIMAIRISAVINWAILVNVYNSPTPGGGAAHPPIAAHCTKSASAAAAKCGIMRQSVFLH